MNDTHHAPPFGCVWNCHECLSSFSVLNRFKQKSSGKDWLQTAVQEENQAGHHLVQSVWICTLGFNHRAPIATRIHHRNQVPVYKLCCHIQRRHGLFLYPNKSHTDSGDHTDAVLLSPILLRRPHCVGGDTNHESQHLNVTLWIDLHIEESVHTTRDVYILIYCHIIWRFIGVLVSSVIIFLCLAPRCSKLLSVVDFILSFFPCSRRLFHRSNRLAYLKYVIHRELIMDF